MAKRKAGTIRLTFDPTEAMSVNFPVGYTWYTIHPILNQELNPQRNLTNADVLVRAYEKGWVSEERRGEVVVLMDPSRPNLKPRSLDDGSKQ